MWSIRTLGCVSIFVASLGERWPLWDTSKPLYHLMDRSKAIEKTKLNASEKYDADYFERGLVLGKSGYMNYSWMPELTLRMVHHIVTQLSITPNHKILDFGCAKGFVVKAFRLLDYECYGVDVSRYAISEVERNLSEYCRLINEPTDIKNHFDFKFDWILSKDVFEHIPLGNLDDSLITLSSIASKMFAVIPLGIDNQNTKYYIPIYENDISHSIRMSDSWWKETFSETGWEVTNFSFCFKGVKENWTNKWEKGNGFFVLESRGLR